MRYASHLELAGRLGMHLHELMGWPGPMTHRQFTTWQAWLAQRWSTPNRSDYYLMQIAFEARNILHALAGSGQQLHLEDFRLQLSHRQQQQQGGMVQSPEEMKSVILGGLGIAPPT